MTNSAASPRIVEAHAHASIEVHGGATLSMRHHLSSHYHWAAQHFARLTAEREKVTADRWDVQHRAYATATIYEGVAFLEATINELYQDAVDGSDGDIPQSVRPALSAFWRKTKDGRGPMLRKYQEALTSFGQPLFVEAAPPYTDVGWLVELRNRLTHYKPKDAVAGVASDIETALRGKFVEHPGMAPGNPFFPDRCLSAGGATWAIDAATAFADEFFSRIGITGNYARQSWSEKP
jgi:hypothetical protein